MIFLKDGDVESSPPMVGYRILSSVQKSHDGRISIFDLAEKFKSQPWFTPETFYFGIIFLYAIGLIEFEAPYVRKA